MEVLKRSLGSELFAEKLVTDERDPVQYFSVPGIDGTWELFAPSWEHWRQLILVCITTDRNNRKGMLQDVSFILWAYLNL